MTTPARPAAPEQDAPLDLSSEMGGLACTHMALRQAARRLGALYDDAVAQTGLKATQVGLMVKIEGLGDPALQDVAKAAAIGLSSLTYALRPLVRDGLVVLSPDPDDKRTKHAALTAQGRAKLKTAIPLWRAANRRADAVLGADTALALRTLADQVSSEAFLKTYTAKG